MVSFDPTTYTVTEGVDEFAVLMLVRSGEISGITTVTVATVSGTAVGMTVPLTIPAKPYDSPLEMNSEFFFYI